MNAEQTVLRADHLFGSEMLFPNLRKGRDSNSRYRFRYAAFRERCLQPLGHLSVFLIFLKLLDRNYYILFNSFREKTEAF